MAIVLDFTDCKTVEDVDKKWLEYAKDLEPYKSLFKKLLSQKNQAIDKIESK